jgi:hypothetical protein
VGRRQRHGSAAVGAASVLLVTRNDAHLIHELACDESANGFALWRAVPRVQPYIDVTNTCTHLETILHMVYNWDGKEAECYRLYVEEKKTLDEVAAFWEPQGFTPRYESAQSDQLTAVQLSRRSANISPPASARSRRNSRYDPTHAL